MAGSYNLGTAEGTIRINYDGTGNKQAIADLEKTSVAAGKSGKGFTEVGRGAAIAGGILAAGLAYATTKAVDFEKELSAIGAVSGASAADLDAMRSKALKLGADTSFSASQAAQAMEELAKAGISVKDILGGAADATVALAAAGGVDLPVAATIASNAMNQFGLTAQELPKVADLIAGAANASAIDVTELGQAMQQAGAVAHLAGLSFQDTAVAIAELGNAGIKGSDAGTSLKTFLQNLIPTTKQQIDLSKQLGLITKDGGNAFFDASGKVKSLADVSQILQNATKGMTKEQQLNTLQILYGSDAIRAAAVLADNGAAGFNKLSDAMNKTSAADVAAARLNNTAGKIEQLKGSAETAAIAIGTILLPGVQRLATFLTQAANKFSSLSKGQQEGIIRAVEVAAAFLLIVAAMAKFIKIYETMKAFVLLIKSWAIFSKLAAVATRIWAIAQLLLDAALSPIGLVVIAIIAIIVAIILVIKYHKQIGAFMVQIWGYIWNFLKAIGAWFAGPFADFFISIWNKVFPVFKAVGDFFVSIFNGIKTGVLAVWSVISAVIGFFAPLFGAVFGFIVDVIKTAWAIVTAITQVAMTVMGAVIHNVSAQISAVWNFLWNNFIATVRFIWGLIGPYITGAISAIWNTIQAVGNGIRTSWGILWNGMLFVIRAVWGFIAPYIFGTISTISSVISSVLGSIRNVWNGAWNFMKAILSTTWSNIVGIVSGAIARVVAIIDGIREMLSRVRGFFNQLKEAAAGGTGSLISFVAGIPGRILGALGNLAGTLYNAGRSIIQGLINGIRDMAGSVRDAVEGVLAKARNLLPFSPAKEGPFSGRGWTLYSGRSLAQAFAAGITDQADAAVTATLSMVQKVSATAQAASPLMQQFNYAGGAQSFSAPAPRVSMAPSFLVVADLGDGVREVVKSTVSQEPGLVADASVRGTQTRKFLAPGRAH